MTELERIRTEFRRRDEDPRVAARNERTAPGNRFLAESRAAAISSLLGSEGPFPLNGRTLLDLGCGTGDDLARFLSAGMHVVGVDLVPERLAAAQARFPRASLMLADGGGLPFRDATFDVVFQSLAFTSVLDRELRASAASEMVRVLKPAGVILWYDFYFNPLNRATRGIRLAELRRLFPGCEIRARRVTLAPPLARRLALLSMQAVRMLEQVPWLRTHYGAAIKRRSQRA